LKISLWALFAPEVDDSLMCIKAAFLPVRDERNVGVVGVWPSATREGRE
jgi:hypothetical protein